MLYQLIKSILILCIISATTGATFYVFNYDFWKGFLLATVLQVILFNIIKYFRNGYIMIKAKELDLEQIKQFDKQGMELKCAHCNALTYVPIRFDEQNVFDCPACGESNSIYVNVTVARETTALNMDAITSKLIVDDEEKAKDEIIIESTKNE